MRDSLGSDRFCQAVCAQWLAEATVVSRRLVTGHDAREDLAHDALLRVLQHPPERENAGAWIQRICRNLHVDAWRDVSRAQRISRDAPACPPSRSGEDVVLAQERRRVVRRALLALPRPQRRALILRFYGGWSFERIAARLGMREATMRTRVHRALAALRAHVATVRLWIAPGALSLKPAIAVLIVLAASVDPVIAPTPASISASDARPEPTAGGRARFFTARGARHVEGTRLAQATPSAAHRGRADGAPRAEPRAPSIVASAVQHYDFDDDQVSGVLQGPDGDGPIESVLPAKNPSLIELRRQFLPEMVKSLEDL